MLRGGRSFAGYIYVIVAEPGNLKQIDNLDAYLFRIARNAVFRYIERSLLFKNYQSRQLSDDNSDLYEIESKLNAKELELIIAIAVAKNALSKKKDLSDEPRQGLNNENIARELNISKRTGRESSDPGFGLIYVSYCFGSSWLLSYKLNKLYKKSVL